MFSVVSVVSVATAVQRLSGNVNANRKHWRSVSATNGLKSAPTIEFSLCLPYKSPLLDSRHMAPRGAGLFSSAYNNFNSRRVCDRAAIDAANA
jgi:hypothetical protein